MSADPFKKMFEKLDPSRRLNDNEIEDLVEGAALFQRIQESARGFPRKRRPLDLLRRAALLSSVAVIVVGSAAAAITFLRSPVTNTTQVSCYSQDSIHSKVILEMPYGTNPLASCKAQLHWKSVSVIRTPAGLLCVLPDGTLGGFPPSKKLESCSSIGLASFNGKLKYPRVLEFQKAAQAYFAENVCPNVTSTEHEILLLIGKYGLRGWTLHENGSSVPGACATFGLQSAKHIIDIVAVIEDAN